MVTLDELITRCGVPAYIKIDVEGFEAEVLRGLSRRIPLVSFECNLPGFKQESIDCVRVLTALDPSARFNYIADDPPAFLAPDWVSGEEMIGVLEETRLECLEVFCREHRPDLA